ncbi:pentatricopeptide repeat-containing protein at5g61800 [Phtheirospermum japonicum]|uniref:Pentatricopeptide repeat-containing protein at5g61800 n=1 Tax=Phtheirospermum japonicum TaxID=374723 RepID=A0A830BAC4_9LAMI|nr:pentatricopeptide repeat-containing protein at5g61800 [Phtheirospermum japonicum]
MQIRCIQTSNLIIALRQSCKSTSQIHQVHAQAITRGLFTLHPTFLLTQILHSFTFLSHSHATNTTAATTAYLTKIFNLIPNPSTFNYNAIIRAHTLIRSPHTALNCYTQMRRKPISPDFHTFPFVLKACCGLSHNPTSLAKNLHSELLKFGFSVDVFVCNALVCAYCRGGDVVGAQKVFDGSLYRDVVSYNVMIDGFVKAGAIDHAREVFDEMPERDAVSWGTLLAGYAKSKRCGEAIELFDRMVGLKVRFDNVALVSVLSACARLGELEKGKKIHHHIKMKGIILDLYLGTALVDLYAKCGCIEMAHEVFQSCRQKNATLWNAMLVGLAMHGRGVMLVQHFSTMVENGVEPDGVTILAVLVGCSHSGLVHEARRIFSEMESVYNVPRELKHYGCMADLLGRAGLINEAVKMIDEMPMRGDVFVWGGLLGGCKIHGNLEVAEAAAKRVMQVKPEDGGVYSVLAHMYANSQRWDDLVKVRRLRDCGWGIKKNAGCSWIELDGITHEFVSGDCLHPYTDEIYFVLNGLELHQYEVV